MHVDDSLISSICVMRWQCWSCTTNFDRTYKKMKSRGFVCSTCNASQTKEDKKRAGQAGSQENKQRAGQAGSKENKQQAGQARGVVASREDKQHAAQAGSKEDKQPAGQGSPKEEKQQAGQAGGQTGAKEDKPRAGQAGAVRRALKYARETLHRLRKLFEGCKVLIVDEVSMVGCRMLRDIHSRPCAIMQCQDKTFGGMCVVLMGDFVQLTPVGQTELFGTVKVQVGGQDLNDGGRELFQKFDEVSLGKQHRATDPQYATSVSTFRKRTASALQTRMEFLDTIVEITPEEFKDPAWQETTIVSIDQKTVHAVNEAMLQRFAIARGLPIVAWRLPMVDKYET